MASPREMKFRVNKKLFSKKLFSLYQQRNNWRKYGALRVFTNEIHILSPVKLWWYFSQIFLMITTCLIGYSVLDSPRLYLIPAFIIGLIEPMAFYKTCLRDPGIQPRKDIVTAFRTLIELIRMINADPNLMPTRMTIHTPGGRSELKSYCWKCHHFRSLKTHHCSVCDCCMMKHDHHCPVYGGCVAKENIGAFHTMVFTQIGFWLYTTGYCIYKIVDKMETFQWKLTKEDLILVTPKLILYVILVEIVAVIVIPPLLNWIYRRLCRKETKQTEVKPCEKFTDEQIAEILEFARANSLNEEEILIIRKLFEYNSSKLKTTQGREDCKPLAAIPSPSGNFNNDDATTPPLAKHDNIV